MTVSHFLILGLFVFAGSLGMAAIQASVARIWVMLSKSLAMKKTASLALVSTSEGRKLSWK